MNRRVVVTGIGIVSPLGLSAEDHFRALAGGACAVAPISHFEVGDFPVQFAAEVTGFKARKFLKNRKSAKMMARDIELAVAAASLAAADGGVYDGAPDPERFGVSMGAGLLPTDLDELGSGVSEAIDEDGGFDLLKYGSEGLRNLFPLWLLKYLPNMLNSHISIEYDARGPNNCLTCGNSGGLIAVGEAARVIERGQADLMLAGGAESRVHPLSLAKLYIQGKLSTDEGLAERGPRPLCRGRSGLVAGEGGAVVLLEEAEHADARGARVYARLAGFAASSGGQALAELSDDAAAAVRSMKGALADSGADAGEVAAVFANASGLAEDAAEARAVAAALGEGKPVTATRAACGHAMAAGGAIDLATACLALAEGVVPGTFGADDPEDVPVELLSSPREREAAALLVNSFSFGGQTASVVLTRD